MPSRMAAPARPLRPERGSQHRDLPGIGACGHVDVQQGGHQVGKGRVPRIRAAPVHDTASEGQRIRRGGGAGQPELEPAPDGRVGRLCQRRLQLRRRRADEACPDDLVIRAHRSGVVQPQLAPHQQFQRLPGVAGVEQRRAAQRVPAQALFHPQAQIVQGLQPFQRAGRIAGREVEPCGGQRPVGGEIGIRRHLRAGEGGPGPGEVAGAQP